MPNLSIALPGGRAATILLVAMFVAACGGATTSPSASPPGSNTPPASTASATPGPTVGAIDHKTGATDVILRIEEGGGFVPIDFLATQAPTFTLYGDGVIVFQPLVTTYPEADANGIVRAIPWRTAKLDEDQIQELLDFALVGGGLGSARESYLADGIADAGNTIFTIRAGGLDKTVVINALFEETRPGPDSVARAAFFTLAQRLRDFDRGGTIASDIFKAERHRGVLTGRDAAPELKPIEWPWPTVKPADFREGANDGSGGPRLPHRVMTADEIAALKLSDIEGGLQGLILRSPDGKLHSFILRPLLVDEKE